MRAIQVPLLPAPVQEEEKCELQQEPGKCGQIVHKRNSVTTGTVSYATENMRVRIYSILHEFKFTEKFIPIIPQAHIHARNAHISSSVFLLPMLLFQCYSCPCNNKQFA